MTVMSRRTSQTAVGLNERTNAVKKLITICLFVLASTTAFAAETVIKNSKSGYASIATVTRADMTLYVRAAGNDSNDCLTSGNACLTIQEAVDRVSKQINHVIEIDVGPGNFAGVDISGFTTIGSGSFKLDGELDNPTLSPDNTTSGTTTGGSTTQCIDSARTWTTNEMIGMLVLVDSEYRVVRDNTGTTINLVGPLGATCSGKAYEILEQKTVLNSDGSWGFPLSLRNIGGTYVSGTNSTIEISDIKVTGGSGSINVYCEHNESFILNRVYCYGSEYFHFYFRDGGPICGYELFATGATSGFYFDGGAEVRIFKRNFAYDNTGSGFHFGYVVTMMIAYDLYADDNDGHGIEMWGTPLWTDFSTVHARNNGKSGVFLLVARGGTVDFDSGSVLEDNARYGIEAGEWGYGNGATGASIGAKGTITIQNNTLGGIHLSRLSNIVISGMTGTGNGGYGLVLEDGSTAMITGATTITGSSGNATINSGSTVLVWSTDFNDDGDAVINIDNGCRIERKD